MTWSRLRLNSLSVVSPCSTSRKCALSRLNARHWRRVRASASEPIKIMNTGINGAVRSRTRPESGSMGKTKPRKVRGTMAARASWGRYWLKYASRLSMPSDATLASSPVRSPRANAGPSATMCAVSRPRKSSLTRCATRAAASSASHVARPRPTLKSSRVKRKGCTPCKSSPRRNAPSTVWARLCAWRTVKMPEAAPPATARRRKMRSGAAARSSRASKKRDTRGL